MPGIMAFPGRGGMITHHLPVKYGKYHHVRGSSESQASYDVSKMRGNLVIQEKV
jgi:hypothetical protein